jgi:hypothetical protein
MLIYILSHVFMKRNHFTNMHIFPLGLMNTMIEKDQGKGLLAYAIERTDFHI